VRSDEREVVERAVRCVTEQAATADAIVDEAMAAGLDGSEPSRQRERCFVRRPCLRTPT
jgi:hypothetical protein